LLSRNNNICLVAPFLNTNGVENNCGSLFFSLAHFLADSEDIETTIIYSGFTSEKRTTQLKDYYTNLGIDFVSVQHDLVPLRPHGRSNEWFIEYSIDIADYLERNSFNTAVFSLAAGNGFAALQRKKLGTSLTDLHTVVVNERIARDIRNIFGLWPSIPHVNMRQSFMEEYCLTSSDEVVIHHSSHRENLDTHTDEEKVVLVPPPSFSKDSKTAAKPDYSRLTIIGGTDANLILPDLLDTLFQANKKAGKLPFTTINFVNFTGNIPSVNIASEGQACESAIAELSDQLSGITVSNNSVDVADHLRKSEPHLVWADSYSSFYNHTLRAALANGHSCLATNISGNRAAVNQTLLLNPDDVELALLSPHEHCLNRDSLLDPGDVESVWLALLRGDNHSPAKVVSNSPKVSICIAHYNYGQYLPELLNSLAAQTYENIEVIVTDDGSTDPDSISEFKALSQSYNDSNWHFYSKENEGIGCTRNFSVQKSSGDLLLFMDADNVALPQMTEVFIRGMNHSTSDCLSCHFDAFEDELPENNLLKPIWRFAPLGGPVELGLIKNVFGDANFCIKRQVFDDLGGFGEDRTTSYEDWEFLARLVLRGFKLDVINRVLFLLRVQSESYSRNSNQRRNMERVFKTYYKEGFVLNEKIAGELLYPYFLNHLSSHKVKKA
jgi:glycosyltransferase involved in cell wall biosynthesis